MHKNTKLCENCNTMQTPGNYSRWHGDKCRAGKRARDPKPSILNNSAKTCEYCDKQLSEYNYNKFHGDKCKYKLLPKKEPKWKISNEKLVECPFCNRMLRGSILSRHIKCHQDKLANLS